MPEGSGYTLGTLQIKLNGNAKAASEGIKSLSSSISQLRSAQNAVAPLYGVCDAVSKLHQSLDKLSLGGLRGLGRLTAGLSRLKTLNTLKLSASIGNQLDRLASVAGRINPGGVQSIGKLADSLSALSAVQKINIGATAKNLEKIAHLDFSKINGPIQQLATIMTPLAAKMRDVADGFSAIPKKLQSYIRGMERASGAAQKHSNVQRGVFGVLKSVQSKIITGGFLSQRIGRMFSEGMKGSNEFVENLNLFDVAMGEAADSSRRYAQRVQDALGIDMSNWVRNQGIFKQITSGFGVASDKANIMSKNLTQLSYDAASFFNLPIEEAMQKFQSGIAGELEPLRRIGYALDVATLQHVALKHGIEGNVNTMTQAEKSQIRYLAIMEQSKNVMGDMARTIMTPANSMRILSMEIELLKRALGNVLIPIVMAVIPYIRAFVEVLTDALNALAGLLGFKLPKIDYSAVMPQGGSEPIEEVADAFGDVADGAAGANQKIKEFKNFLLGFDEMHIMPSLDTDPTKGGSGAGGRGGAGLPSMNGGLDNIKLPQYDFLAGLNNKTKGLKEMMERILSPVRELFKILGRNPGWAGLGALGLAAMKVAPKLGELKWLGAALTKSGIIKLLPKIGLAAAGAAIEFMGVSDGMRRIYDDSENKLVGIAEVIGSLGVGAAALGFALGPGGLVVAGLVGVVAAIHGANEGLKQNAFRRLFGDLQLTNEEISALAETLSTNTFSVKIGMVLEQQNIVEEARAQVDKAARTLAMMNYRFKFGAEISQKEWMNAYDDFIVSGQKYVDEAPIKVKMEFDALFGENPNPFVKDWRDRMIGKMDTWREQWAAKGRELREILATGFNEKGEWFPDKKAEADKICKEMAEIKAQVQRFESKIADNKMRLDIAQQFEVRGINKESIAAVLRQTQEAIQGEIEHAKNLTATAYAHAEIEFKDDPVKMQKAKDEATAAFNKQLTEIYAKPLQFVNEAIMPKYQAGFDVYSKNIVSSLDKSVLGQLKNSQIPEKAGAEVSLLLNEAFNIRGQKFEDGMFDQYTDALKKDLLNASTSLRNDPAISDDLRRTAGDVVKMLEPKVADVQKMVDSYRATGRAVPESLLKTLQDNAMLEEIGGVATQYPMYIAEQMSTDPVVLNSLSTVEGAGKKLVEQYGKGISNSFQLVRDQTTGEVTGVQNIFSKETLAMTDTLKKNFEGMGWAFSNSLAGGVQQGVEQLETQVNQAAERTSSAARSAGQAVGSENARGVSETTQQAADSVKELGDQIKLETPGMKDGQSIYNGVYKAFQGVPKGIIANQEEVAYVAQQMANAIESPFVRGFRTIMGGFNEMIGNISSSANSFRVNVNASGSGSGYYNSSISGYASGGFPSAGEVYIARENGENEYVGKFGNKNAVANNDQIREGIASAVYRAMITAYQSQKSGERGEYIQINVDGRTKYENFVREANRRNKRAGRVIIPVEG